MQPFSTRRGTYWSRRSCATRKEDAFFVEARLRGCYRFKCIGALQRGSRTTMSASTTLRLAAILVLPCLALAARAPIACADSSLLVGRGSRIVDVNFGYGRWLDSGAPPGSFGFGVGFLHFTSDYSAVGVDLTADRLGQLAARPGHEAENLELVSVLAQGLVHPPAKNLTPYIGVGTGPYFFRSSGQTTEQAKTNWGFMGRTGFRM